MMTFRYTLDLATTPVVALLLEVNRTIPISEVTAALGASSAATVRVSPLGDPHSVAPRTHGEWMTVFAELDRFFGELQAQEADAGTTANVHVFGCAPIPVMIYAGFRLGRRPLTTYQQDRGTGVWTSAFSTTADGPSREFLSVEGLPDERRPGRGDIVVSVGITHDVALSAEAQFLASTGLEPLAKVHARPVAGAAPDAMKSARDAVGAATQLRQILDSLHTRLPAAERVLLAVSSPASVACALGTSINPNAQHALVLHNYRPDEGYVPVYEIKAADPKPLPRTPSAADTRRAVETLEQVAAVYQRLASWIAKEPDLADAVGGADFSSATVQCTPVDGELFGYPYMAGRWVFDTDFALSLRTLRESVGSEDWAECLRLFFVHEGIHTRQGLTTYRFQGIGRAGFVLEAIDYDADVKSVEACLAWRKENRPDDFRSDGELGLLAHVLANVLRMGRTFNPTLSSGTAHELLERNLRRYLIWSYQFSRARGFVARAQLDDFQLAERVAVELPGLPVRADFQNGYFRPHVGVLDDQITDEAELVVYHQGVLYRKKDRAWIRRLLNALLQGDLEELATTWAVFFDAHPALTGRQ